MTADEENSFKDEIQILSKLDHPNILKLYEVYTDDKRYYIVTELCKGGELFDEILKKGTYNEKEAANVAQQILQAVSYFHDQKVVHRDLKPENVLVDKEQNNCLKIIDFGTSIVKKENEKLTKTHCTSYYIAPEVLKGNYDEKCDIWSVGVILYILLSGKPPFDGKDDEEITAKVKKGVWTMNDKIWENVSGDAKNLIKQMLNVDVAQRLSAKQALQNPWFKNAPDNEVNIDLMKESLKNLLNFNATQKMQQATMSMMVQNMISKEEIGRLSLVFQQLDKNKDGKLQYQELLDGYEEFYGDFAKVEVDRIFKLVDVDNSGEIDFSEFVTATVNRGELLQHDKLKAAFEMYDKDGSGSISTDEIKQVLGVGKDISEEVWQQIVIEVDANGDGEVSFEEFQIMMTQLLR